MDFQKRINEAQEALNKVKDDMTELVTMAEAAERDLSGEESALLENYEEEAARLEKRITDLGRAERIAGAKAVQAAPQAPAIVKRTGSTERKPGELFFRMATNAILAKEHRLHPVESATKYYAQDAEFQEFVKTAVNPGATDVSGWAAELVDDALQGFLDVLRAQSVGFELLGMAGISLNFDGLGSIKVPTREGTSTDLRSGWTGERDAIPVRRATTGSITIYPYKWGVISTFSKELAMRSTPQIEALVRQFILQDTAEQLDKDLFTADVAVAGFRPAGLFNGITGQSASIASDLVQRINDDIKALKKGLIDQNCWTSPMIYMSEGNALEIEYAMTADGEFPFRDDISQGRLGGVPVRTSNNIVSSELLIVDTSGLAAAVGAPAFSVSDTATLVEVDDDGVSPTMNPTYPRTPQTGQVGDAARDTVNNPPIRSLFQTETVAVKQVQYLSWHRMRDECVYRITGVDYPA